MSDEDPQIGEDATPPRELPTEAEVDRFVAAVKAKQAQRAPMDRSLKAPERDR